MNQLHITYEKCYISISQIAKTWFLYFEEVIVNCPSLTFCSVSNCLVPQLFSVSFFKLIAKFHLQNLNYDKKVDSLFYKLFLRYTVLKVILIKLFFRVCLYCIEYEENGGKTVKEFARIDTSLKKGTAKVLSLSPG